VTTAFIQLDLLIGGWYAIADGEGVVLRCLHHSRFGAAQYSMTAGVALNVVERRQVVLQ
jgi:hypothetical protein